MVDEVGKDKVGRIECIVCGDYFWYNETGHQSSHSVDKPQTYEEYKEFVGETFDLEEDHPLLEDDTVVNPNKWVEVRDQYPEVEIGLKLK